MRPSKRRLGCKTWVGAKAPTLPPWWRRRSAVVVVFVGVVGCSLAWRSGAPLQLWCVGTLAWWAWRAPRTLAPPAPAARCSNRPALLRGFALGMAVGELGYALRRPATPRYPFNYLPDLAYVVAFVCLATWLARPRGRVDVRVPPTAWRRWASRGGFGLRLLVAVALQARFVLLPMGALAHVTGLGHALAWAYTLATAWVTAQVLPLALRARHDATILRVHGVLLMVAADFVCRHAALGARLAHVALGEVLWLLGLALFVVTPQPSAPRHRPPRSFALAPWLSVRALLGGWLACVVPATLLVTRSAGWLKLHDGHRLGLALCGCWMGALVGNLVATRAASALRRAGRGRLHAAAALHEVRLLSRRRRRERRLGSLAAQAAHDLRGPVALLQAVGAQLGPRAGALGRLLADAGARAEALAERLLHVRRRLLTGPPGRGGQRTASLRPGQPGRPGRPKRTTHARARRAGQPVAAAPRLCVVLARVLAETRLRAPALAHNCLCTRLRVATAGGWVRLRLRQLPPAWRQLRVAVPAMALHQALANLLTNALQAPRRRGTRTWVALVRRRHAICVVVADSARGMRHVRGLGRRPLRPGQRSRSVAAASRPGNGLGLWRARNALRRWGGRWTLRSWPGVGTRVYLTLPCVRLRRAPRTIAPRRPAVRHVVVVDDDVLVRRAWRLRGVAPPLQLHCCASAAACWRLVAQLRAGSGGVGDDDVVFRIDDRLGPGGDGRALRRALRALGYARVVRLGGNKLPWT